MGNNVTTVILVFMLMSIVSFMCLELGITAPAINPPETPEGTPTVTTVFTWVFNSIASFFQIITFQTDLPIYFSMMLFTPIGFGMLYLVIVVIRGGAS